MVRTYRIGNHTGLEIMKRYGAVLSESADIQYDLYYLGGQEVRFWQINLNLTMTTQTQAQVQVQVQVQVQAAPAANELSHLHRKP